MSTTIEVDFCAECVGTGVVIATWDESTGEEDIEECDMCGGTGHWNAETQLPAPGPCSNVGCAGCTDGQRLGLALDRLFEALVEATGLPRFVAWLEQKLNPSSAVSGREDER